MLSHSKYIKSAYSINDLKGNNDLDKIKKYLLKSMNIEITKFELWQFINSLRILRNKIVHENSTVQESDNEINNLKSFSSNRFNLELDYPSETVYNINLNNENFLSECLNNVGKFIRETMLSFNPNK